MADNTVKITLQVTDDGSIKILDQVPVKMKAAEAGTQSFTAQLKENWVAWTAVTTAAVLFFNKVDSSAKSIASLGNEIALHSKTLGMNVEEFQRWQYVAKTTGVSADELIMAFKMIAVHIEQASQGSAESRKLFDQMGISVKSLSDQTRPLSEKMLDVMDKFSGWSDGGRKLEIANAAIGRSSQQVTNFMSLGRTGYEEAAAAADKYGVATERTVQKLKEASEVFERSAAATQKMEMEWSPLIELWARGKEFMADMGAATKLWVDYLQSGGLHTIASFFGIWTGMPTAKAVFDTNEGTGKQPTKPPPPKPRTDIEIKAESELIQLLLKQIAAEKEIAGFDFDLQRKDELGKAYLETLDQQLNNKVRQILEDKQLIDSEKVRQIVYEKSLANSERDLEVLKQKKEKLDDVQRVADLYSQLQMKMTEADNARVAGTMPDWRDSLRNLNAGEMEITNQYGKVVMKISEWEAGLENVKKLETDILQKTSEIGSGQYGIYGKESEAPGLRPGYMQIGNKLINLSDAEKQMTDINNFWTGIATNMGQSLTSGFFNVFKDGMKDAGEAFKQFGMNMLNSFSNVVQQLITNWLMFGSIMGSAGYAKGASFGGILGLFGMTKAASGFEGWTNGPTPILAGEAGREFVSVTPEAQMDRQGRGHTTVHYHHYDNSTNISKVDLIDGRDVEERLGPYINNAVDRRNRLLTPGRRR